MAFGSRSQSIRKSARLWLLSSVLVLAACAQKPAPAGINDPDEAKNREIHAFNLAVDRAVLKPLSGGATGSIPTPVKDGLSNFAANADAPADVVNNLLQGRPHHALENTFRFVVNTTIGLGGLFDPARAIGVDGRPTDFGETMHVWGAGEGSYLVLPLIGPSTERDLVGSIVDVAINPLRVLLPQAERNGVTLAKLGARIGDRSTYSETVDQVLYESADSYAQARLLYLQNRRYRLGQTTGEAADDAFLDPYEDPYGN